MSGHFLKVIPTPNRRFVCKSWVLTFRDDILRPLLLGDLGRHLFALILLVPQSMRGILQRKAYVSLYRLRPC